MQFVFCLKVPKIPNPSSLTRTNRQIPNHLNSGAPQKPSYNPLKLEANVQTHPYIVSKCSETSAFTTSSQNLALRIEGTLEIWPVYCNSNR